MTDIILILSNSIDGLFLFRKEVINAIIASKYKVFISAPKGDKDKECYFQNLGCILIPETIDRRGTNPLKDFILFVNYYRLLKKIKPLAVLTYTIKPNIYGGLAARLSNIPQLANITGLGSGIHRNGILQRFTRTLYKVGLSQAQVVFYQNRSIMKFCAEYGIGRNGVLLPGSGVNLQWHKKQKYPDIDKPIKFLFIGRIMEEKGVNEFLEMAKYVKERFSHVEFHLLGACEENYEDKLLQLQNADIIKWHGAVSDVRPYIKESHCIVLPSYHEGMANVLLEASACSRPVITSNIDGCKEIVDDGITGYICAVKNTRSLIDKVIAFIALPYEEKVIMGEKAREKVEKEFDRQIIVENYLNVIDCL